MEKVTTIIKISKDVDVIIPERIESIEDIEQREKLIGIKLAWQKQDILKRKRDRRVLKRLSKVVATLFM